MFRSIGTLALVLVLFSPALAYSPQTEYPQWAAENYARTKESARLTAQLAVACDLRGPAWLKSVSAEIDRQQAADMRRLGISPSEAAAITRQAATKAKPEATFDPSLRTPEARLQSMCGFLANSPTLMMFDSWLGR